MTTTRSRLADLFDKLAAFGAEASTDPTVDPTMAMVGGALSAVSALLGPSLSQIDDDGCQMIARMVAGGCGELWGDDMEPVVLIPGRGAFRFAGDVPEVISHARLRSPFAVPRDDTVREIDAGGRPGDDSAGPPSAA